MNKVFSDSNNIDRIPAYNRSVVFFTSNSSSSWRSGWVGDMEMQGDVGNVVNDDTSITNSSNTTLQPRTATTTTAATAAAPAAAIHKGAVSNANHTCFIHVGKTAGSTISCILGVTTDACIPNSTAWLQYEEERVASPLVQNIQLGGHVHMKGGVCHRQTDSFLISTRNVIHRMNSWYYYEKDFALASNYSDLSKYQRWKNRGREFLWNECYGDTFEDLILRGLSSSSVAAAPHTDGDEANSTSNNDRAFLPPADVRSMTCPQRAMAAVTGARGFAIYNHNWYNYEYYWELTQTLASGQLASGQGRPANVFVLRNEHLANDWNKIDSMLGGNGTSGEKLFATKLRDNSKKKQDTSLSGAALEILCDVLCLEIQFYKQILHAAVNLDEMQVQESISEIQSLCPKETNEPRECPPQLEFPRLPQASDPFIGAGKPRFKCSMKKNGQLPLCKSEDLLDVERHNARQS